MAVGRQSKVRAPSVPLFTQPFEHHAVTGTIFGTPFVFQSFRQTSGYTTGDLFVSWVPSGKYISPLLRGFRLDAGIDNIWDQRYRTHISIYPEAGINLKMALSYTVQFGGPN